MSRRRKEAANKAVELRDQARGVAGQSGEALKEFAETTGGAAKDFAATARDAAKELLDAIERAGKKVEPEPKRGRKALKLTIALGVGAAILANERVRDLIGSALGRSRGDSTQPEVWRPDRSATGNNEVREPVAGETPV